MRKPTPSPEASKIEWRTWALEARQTLDFPSLSVALCERLLAELREAQDILVYAATEWELEVLGLVDRLPEKRFYLPRCAESRRLAIHAYPCKLALSRFGIREPKATLPELSPEILDVVLVPALVLDRRGFRLGYGGGYYDRFLPRLHDECRTIGIAPFLVNELPTDPWDVPVGGLLTGGEMTGD